MPAPIPHEESFCLLKPEAYLFGKSKCIEQHISDSGLKTIETWKVKLEFRDVFRMYDGLMPRITMSLRLLPLIHLDLFILRGSEVVNRMHDLKYQIRREMWGLKLGGFLHAPDSVEEYHDHMRILTARRLGERQVCHL